MTFIYTEFLSDGIIFFSRLWQDEYYFKKAFFILIRRGKSFSWVIKSGNAFYGRGKETQCHFK